MFKNDSVVFVSDRSKLDILKKLSEKSLFLNLRFYDPLKEMGTFSNRYYFFIKDNFALDFDLARKIRPYFAFLDVERNYKSARLNFLREILKAMLAQAIYRPPVFPEGFELYSVAGSPVPAFIGKGIWPISIENKVETEISLSISDDQIQSCYAVYQRIVKLLEDGMNPDDIVILNATAEDEYYLEKLLSDSQIYLHVSKAKPLANLPRIIELIRYIRKVGLRDLKDYLDAQLSVDERQAVVKLLNHYAKTDLQAHPEILISLLETTHQTLETYQNCLISANLSSLNTDPTKIYLLMNYSHDQLLKEQDSFAYLTESEAKELGYYSLAEINKFKNNEIRSFLESCNNLYLFHAAESEGEKLLPDLKLEREIIIDANHDYSKEVSYFQTLDQLEYAKAKYAYEKYHLLRDDFQLLDNTYGLDYSHYTHDYSGILDTSLKRLIDKHNSLSGAKLESYQLCEFQFLCKYLLQLGKPSSSSNQVMGTITHKVLESLSKDPQSDYQEIVASWLDFPEEEKFKEKVYRKALLQELQKLVPIFVEFHQQSKFNLIETEIEFDIPYQNFRITGVIDKAMVYPSSEEKAYFVLVDYKISNNDFNLSDLENGRRLQLPVYLYAFVKLHELPHKAIGIYYQKTSLGRLKREVDNVEKSFQLKGISVDSPALLTALDSNLEHLSSLALKNDGTLRKNEKRLYQQSKIDQIYNQVEVIIDKTIKGINSGSFKINPIPSYGHRKDSVSCEYCDFAHICYNKNRGLGGDDE